LTSSISDNDQNPVRIFPNPTRDVLHVENHEKTGFYTIFNLQGKSISKGTYEDKIDVRDLASGLFFIQLSDENQKKVNVLKFVKE
jgi:hypothetical protein